MSQEPANNRSNPNDNNGFDPIRARAGRNIAMVIVAAGLLTILAPMIISMTGLPARYEFLFYLMSMAAFIWALVVAVKLWQKAKQDG